jgi:AcrR family transcriptional regulator
MSTMRELDDEARSQRTRDKVLDAAVAVLIRDGYAGASTLRIQKMADISRGRLLHQYPNRDELLVAAAQHLAKVGVHATTGLVDWPVKRADRLDAAVAAMWDTYHEGYFWAATELWLAARHNPALAAALSPGEHDIGRQVREATDAFFGAEIARCADYPDVRELLNTSMRGVALTYGFNPRDHRTDPHMAMWRSVAREKLL